MYKGEGISQCTTVRIEVHVKGISFSTMKFIATAIVSILVVVIPVRAEYKSYNGYQVLSTEPLDQDGIKQVMPLLEDSRFYFWDEPGLERRTLIMSPAEHLKELRGILEGLNPQVYVADVEQVVESERIDIESQTRAEGFGLEGNVTFNRFMKFNEIMAYMDSMALKYPELVTIIDLGKTYENRNLRMMKISSGPGKKAILMDAGIHAREWIAPTVALKTIFELLEKKDEDMLQLADWYVIPIANPDGYEYSWTSDRFWRKNRNPSKNCYGVDLNRNFGVHWEENKNKDTCVYNYAGKFKHSEIETRSIADFIKTKGSEGDLKLYMALHAYGRLLLHPFGYNMDQPSEEMIEAAKDTATAVHKIRGTNYTVGSITKLLYPAYGNSQDYAYSIAGVPYSYTWELPPGGISGFDISPTEIKAVVKETWEGIKFLACRAIQESTKTSDHGETTTIQNESRK